jgi:hypothetical protein
MLPAWEQPRCQLRLTFLVARSLDNVLNTKSAPAPRPKTLAGPTPSSSRLLPLELAAMILAFMHLSTRAVSRAMCPYPCVRSVTSALRILYSGCGLPKSQWSCRRYTSADP